MRNFWSLSFSHSFPFAIALSLFLNVCTYRSACPFELGWRGAINFACMPFTSKKCNMSCERNCPPLSNTWVISNPRFVYLLGNIYRCHSRNRCCWHNLKPCGKCICNYEKVIIHEWSCAIYMDSAPWLFWVLPYVNWYFYWIFLHKTTNIAFLYLSFNVNIYILSPDIVSC